VTLLILNQAKAFYTAGQTIFQDVRLLDRLPPGKALNLVYAEPVLVLIALALVVWARPVQDESE